MLHSPITISADNLTVAYGQNIALSGISCTTAGKVTAVVGHNGSGKSTLMKAILRLLPPRSGAVGVREANQDLIPERDMAFSPEHGAVFADIKVESYVQLWCRIRCHNAKAYRTTGADFLEKLEIGPLLPKLGRALSKGQRQRVQTFIGFLLNPRLFVFDEPFDGLDVMQTRRFSQLMTAESQKRGILLSSHRMDVVERLADQIIVLREGSCFAAGSVAEVKRVMCGEGITVLAPSLSDERLSQLRSTLSSALPHILVTRVGREIVLVGHSCELEDVKQLVLNQGIQDALVSVGEPSLVDAMDYHLRSMKNGHQEDNLSEEAGIFRD